MPTLSLPPLEMSFLSSVSWLLFQLLKYWSFIVIFCLLLNLSVHRKIIDLPLVKSQQNVVCKTLYHGVAVGGGTVSNNLVTQKQESLYLSFITAVG